MKLNGENNAIAAGSLLYITAERSRYGKSCQRQTAGGTRAAPRRYVSRVFSRSLMKWKVGRERGPHEVAGAGAGSVRKEQTKLPDRHGDGVGIGTGSYDADYQQSAAMTTPWKDCPTCDGDERGVRTHFGVSESESFSPC